MAFRCKYVGDCGYEEHSNCPIVSSVDAGD